MSGHQRRLGLDWNPWGKIYQTTKEDLDWIGTHGERYIRPPKKTWTGLEPTGKDISDHQRRLGLDWNPQEKMSDHQRRLGLDWNPQEKICQTTKEDLDWIGTHRKRYVRPPKKTWTGLEPTGKDMSDHQRRLGLDWNPQEKICQTTKQDLDSVGATDWRKK